MSFTANTKYQETMIERVHELSSEGQHGKAVAIAEEANSLGLGLGVDICKHNRLADYCSKCENDVDGAIGN